MPAILCIASTHPALATNFWFDNNGSEPGFGVANGETYNWTSETPPWSSSGTGSGAGLVTWPITGSSNDAILTGPGPGQSYTMRLGSDGTAGISVRSISINLYSATTGANGFGNVTIGQPGDTGAIMLTGNQFTSVLNDATLAINNPINANSRSLTIRGGNVILNGAITANNSTGGAINMQAGAYDLDSGTLTLAGANVGYNGSTSYGGTILCYGYTGYTPRPSDATSPWPAWCRTGY